MQDIGRRIFVFIFFASLLFSFHLFSPSYVSLICPACKVTAIIVICVIFDFFIFFFFPSLKVSEMCCTDVSIAANEHHVS